MLFGFLLVLPLMLIIITGNLLYRYGFFCDSDIKTLTKTLYWIILPALLFRATFTSGREIFANGGLLAAVNATYILTAIVAWLAAALIFHRGQKKRIAVSIMTSIRANNMYIGFPVVTMALGDAGLAQASIYFAISIVFFQVISISGAEIALCGKLSGDGIKKVIRSLSRNPLLIACVSGLLLSMTGLPQLPKFIDETLQLTSGAATAVALLALGASLDLSGVSRIFRIFTVTWEDDVIRYIVNPAMMLFFVKLFRVPPLLAQVTVLITAMPAAVNCFILAKEMGMDEEYCANVVAATTILGAVAIPFWTMILGIS
jgi:malonate transporter